jgi:hypothetical protein
MTPILRKSGSIKMIELFSANCGDFRLKLVDRNFSVEAEFLHFVFRARTALLSLARRVSSIDLSRLLKELSRSV